MKLRFKGKSYIFRLLSLVAGFAVVLSLFYYLDLNPDPKHFTNNSKEYFMQDKIIGWKAIPNVQTRSKRYIGPTKIMDSVYTFDEFSRRVVPDQNYIKNKKTILFFGGSNTFGEGLNDNQSLPYYFSRFAPDYQIYNYAFQGYSIQQFVAMAENYDFKKQIEGQPVYAFYVYMNYHLKRLVGKEDEAKNVLDTPYYYEKDQHIVRGGFFRNAQPLTSKASRRLAQWGIEKIFPWPTRTDAEDMEFMCRIFKKAENNLKVALPEIEFYVVLHPWGETPGIADCLRKHKVKFIDARRVYEGMDQLSMHTPINHTNEIANEVMGESLAEMVNEL